MSPLDPAAYLARIGVERPSKPDLASLRILQAAHLRAVPFENLHVFAHRTVDTSDAWAYDKIVRQGRGGWCFEVNGGFAWLLESLGYTVRRLGAAVLLGGPSVVVDHLVLEVQLDQPYLVEVGFGDDAPTEPLPLAHAGAIETAGGIFELLPSPQGTTLAQHVDGIPEPRYRFKRVHHDAQEFAPASQRLQADRSLFWSTAPFATRLVDDDGTRLTLTSRSLKRRVGSEVERTAVGPADWNAVLLENFGITETFSADVIARAAQT